MSKIIIVALALLAIVVGIDSLAIGILWLRVEQHAANESALAARREARSAQDRVDAERRFQRALQQMNQLIAQQGADFNAQAMAMEKKLADMRNAPLKEPSGLRPRRFNPMPPLEPQPVAPQVMHGRAWGPEQATGAPDTPAAGDYQTAWASRTQDDQPEWLQLEYDAAVKITKVVVYESYNTGALNQIGVFDENGKEIEVWRGNDPTPVGAGIGASSVTLAAPTISKLVKIYLNSQAVAGWNEIDAVGIVDDANKTHWAVRATASSTYASVNEDPALPAAPPRPVVPPDQNF